jgi:hypothetical protein
VSILGKRIAGYSCIILGVAGLAIPFLPGIPLLLIGLKLLNAEHLIARFVRLFRRWRKDDPS